MLFSSKLVICQDYILIINTDIKIVKCKSIQINNGVVSYKTVENEQESSLPIDDIYGINFFEDKPHELYFPSYQIDTIKCSVDSVSSNLIYYHQGNGIKATIEKYKVFNIQFGELQEVNDLDAYRSLFIKLCKSERDKSVFSVTMNSGKEFSDVSQIGLNEKVLVVNVNLNNKQIRTTTNVKDIKCLNNIPFIRKRELGNVYAMKDYLLNNNSEFKKVSLLTINDSTINFSILFKYRLINFCEDKKSLKGLFFQNYKSVEEDPSIATNLNISNWDKSAKSFLNVDFSTGIGYRILDAPPKTSDDFKEFINKTRKGLVFDINLNKIISSNFSIGAKYNRFSTSYSIEDYLREDISVSFYGGSIICNMPFPKNVGFFSASFSVGSCTFLIKEDYFGNSHNYCGSNVAYYASSGIDFCLFENITLGIRGGVLFGSIKKMKIDGESGELREPEDLGRVDGLLCIRVFF